MVVPRQHDQAALVSGCPVADRAARARLQQRGGIHRRPELVPYFERCSQTSGSQSSSVETPLSPRLHLSHGLLTTPGSSRPKSGNLHHCPRRAFPPSNPGSRALLQEPLHKLPVLSSTYTGQRRLLHLPANRMWREIPCPHHFSSHLAPRRAAPGTPRWRGAARRG